MAVIAADVGVVVFAEDTAVVFCQLLFFAAATVLVDFPAALVTFSAFFCCQRLCFCYCCKIFLVVYFDLSFRFLTAIF